jgi:hypothetical protein
MHTRTNYFTAALLLLLLFPLLYAQQSMAKTAEAENMAIAHINVKEQKQLEALADRNLCLKVRCAAAPQRCLHCVLFNTSG